MDTFIQALIKALKLMRLVWAYLAVKEIDLKVGKAGQSTEWTAGNLDLEIPDSCQFCVAMGLFFRNVSFGCLCSTQLCSSFLEVRLELIHLNGTDLKIVIGSQFLRRAKTAMSLESLFFSLPSCSLLMSLFLFSFSTFYFSFPSHAYVHTVSICSSAHTPIQHLSFHLSIHPHMSVSVYVFKYL